ncbi:MAG: ATP-binding cassette domain-containing protein [Phycisphaerales bacterium]|nr:ATP-binding cassette domain-containing protein [Phycisphaerales bacterium]
MPLIASNIHFAYPRARPILTGVSASFAPGAITVLVGPNGAGKSTFLKLLLGALRPQSGSITLDSRPLASIPARARAARLAYIPQHSYVAAPFSVRQVVTLGRFALPPDDRAIDTALDHLSLTHLASEPFGALSAGQQQRITLARALAQLGWPSTPTAISASSTPAAPTRILLADEPFSAMDPRFALHGAQTLRDLAAAGVAVIIVLHDLTFALRLAHGGGAVLLDSSGVITAHGSATDVLTSPEAAAAFGVTLSLHETPAGPVITPVLPSTAISRAPAPCPVQSASRSLAP